MSNGDGQILSGWLKTLDQLREPIDNVGGLDFDNLLSNWFFEPASSGPTTVYIGPSTRSDRYLGTRTDAEMYLGANTLFQ